MSNLAQPVGLLSSGTTRNSMGAPGAATDAADGCGVTACCVEHPATRALATASATNVPVKLRICCLPFHCRLQAALTQFQIRERGTGVRGWAALLITSPRSRSSFDDSAVAAAGTGPLPTGQAARRVVFGPGTSPPLDTGDTPGLLPESVTHVSGTFCHPCLRSLTCWRQQLHGATACLTA